MANTPDTYISIQFLRAGAVSQIVEFDTAHRTPQQIGRQIRVWLTRMSQLETTDDYTIHIRPSTFGSRNTEDS